MRQRLCIPHAHYNHRLADPLAQPRMPQPGWAESTTDASLKKVQFVFHNCQETQLCHVLFSERQKKPFHTTLEENSMSKLSLKRMVMTSVKSVASTRQKLTVLSHALDGQEQEEMDPRLVFAFLDLLSQTRHLIETVSSNLASHQSEDSELYQLLCAHNAQKHGDNASSEAQDNKDDADGEDSEGDSQAVDIEGLADERSMILSVINIPPHLRN